MKYKSTCAVAFAAAGCLLLAGCASNSDTGTLLGGATGAILGNQIGGGSGNIAATAIGAVAGAWVGNRIGARLDASDRQRLYEDSQRTAETGQPHTFYNPDTGVRGRTHVVRSDERGARSCRTVRQTVVLRNGQETYEDVRTCRGPSGWAVD